MSRIRRDPRQELAAVTVSVAPRLRIDRAHRGGGATFMADAVMEPPTRLHIAEPVYFVFAVADAPGGVLSRHDKQVLGAARALAWHKAVAVVFGDTKEDTGTLGADRFTSLPGGYYP